MKRKKVNIQTNKRRKKIKSVLFNSPILFFPYISIVAFVTISFSISSGAVEKKPTLKTDPVPNSGDSTVFVAKSDDQQVHDSDASYRVVLEKLDEIYTLLEKNSPLLKKKLLNAQNSKVINTFINAFNIGVKYISDAQKQALDQNRKGAKPQSDKSNVYPAIIIAANRILYLRIDTFDEKTFAQLKKDCLRVSKLFNVPVGIVIDLRSCHDGKLPLVMKSLSLFCVAAELPKCPETKNKKAILKWPLVILTGEKTSGGGEIFSSLITKGGRGLTIGEKTAGNPFARRMIRLSSGGWLSIPDVPEYLLDLNTKPLVPTMFQTAYPQIEYEKLSEKAGTEMNDKILTRAADLLVCLNLLTKKQKQ